MSPEHVSQWLGAYHDGELSGQRLRQVEEHLAACPDCQAELSDLRGLSFLLQADAPGVDFLPADRFAANLAFSLPRRPAQPPATRPLKISGWLIPAGLLAAWLFVEISLTLNAALRFAAGSGLLDGALTGLRVAAPQMEWFSAAMRLFGERISAPGQAAMFALNDANVFLVQLAGQFMPQLLLALAYCGWLLAWWLRQSHPAHSAEERPLS